MQIRFTDAAHTKGVISFDDGRTLGGPLPPNDGEARKLYDDFIAGGGVVAPFQRWLTLEAAIAALTADAEKHARALRLAVAGTDDATKLAVYREKYAVAVQALAGEPAALAALAPEAEAREETAADLAALVKSLGDQWTAAGLAIDAAYQTHKAAILALESLEDAGDYDLTAGWPF